MEKSLSMVGGAAEDYAVLHACCRPFPDLRLLGHGADLPDQLPDILLVDRPLTGRELERTRGCFLVLLLCPGDAERVARTRGAANYVLYKPVLWPLALRRVLRLLGEEVAEDVFCEAWQEKQMGNLLQGMGMPPHLLGYRYIKYGGLVMARQQNPMQLSMMRQVYPLIAGHEHTTPIMVDRTMRHAIDVAWRKGSPKRIASYFGYCILDKKGMPTNAEFLHVLAEKMRLLLGVPAQARFWEVLSQIDRRTDCGIDLRH
ncbi:MAG: sporulation initiation factor Spo0A C-terminal domain-containing protein [Clostridiales bacterium]|nr:sporulation initiation factor Spo0A C-terminal domain-containing protein [Clostridiales bacterium]